MYVMVYDDSHGKEMVQKLKVAATVLRKVGVGVAGVRAESGVLAVATLPSFYFCPDVEPADCEAHTFKRRRKCRESEEKCDTTTEDLTSDDVVDWSLEEAVDELMLLPSKFHIAERAYALLKERRYGPKSPWDLPPDDHADDASHIAREARGELWDQSFKVLHDEL
mmetsp:Transcript_27161/g.87764  ORF Transcript_27161/g.87764 Transcript_27161/m.87764 type:complete len:166 (+) Transcript_27161:291-788(+)